MDWQRWSQELKDILRLDVSPVAVTYSHTGPEGAVAPDEKLSVCLAIRRAAEGETVDLTADNSSCSGGSVSLGLAELPAGSMEGLTDFLVKNCRKSL